MKACFLFVIFLLISSHLYPVSINPRYASLTAKGPAIKITVSQDRNEPFDIIISSNIIFSADSMVSYPSDFNMKDTKAWVIVRNLNNNKSDTCYISVVPWIANLSELKITKKIDERYAILGKTEDTLLVVYKNKLYKSGGDLKSLIYLSDFEVKSSDYYWGYLRTPAGSFIRKDKDIFYSADERNWTLDYTTKGRGIRNSFSYTYDSISRTTRVFAHDYSVTGQDTFPHSVYRKTISPTKVTQWEKVLTFYSKVQWAENQTLFPACRHIHSIVNDPYTGHIWIGTGDLDQHSHIYYSDDNGTSWKQVGMGSQEWRILSIWFTPGYVYWSMDTSASPQKILRVSRDVYEKNGFWPNMSPKITEGNQKLNIRYMIASITEDNYYYKLGRRVGDIVYGNPKAVVNDSNVVYALNDPVNDYREIVASLPNNALWNSTNIYDQKGDIVTVMASNAEGQAIDNRPRVFGIKERVNGSVDVQELLSTNQGKGISSQFYPYEQDAMGNMYFQTYEMNTYSYQGLIQTQLIWKDNNSVEPGVLVAEEKKDANILLTLIGYEADSLVWQMSPDRILKWTNLPDVEGKPDILNVLRDSARTMLYRTLVIKDGLCPVASNYVKVEKKVPISDNEKIKSEFQGFKYLLVYNNNQKYLTIRSIDSIPGIQKIVLCDLSGRVIFADTYNFLLNNTYEVDVSHLQKGIYLLRVYDGTRDHMLAKLMFN